MMSAHFFFRITHQQPQCCTQCTIHRASHCSAKATWKACKLGTLKSPPRSPPQSPPRPEFCRRSEPNLPKASRHKATILEREASIFYAGKWETQTERTITHAVMEKSYSQVECLICKSCCFKTTFWEVTTSKCTPSNNHLW